MKELLQQWFNKTFADPQVTILAFLLVIGFAIVLFFGQMLTPLIAALVFAYLLEAVVKVLHNKGVPRILAVIFVFIVFVFLFLFLSFGLLPLLSSQIAQLVQELPKILSTGQNTLLKLPELYPTFISNEQVTDIIYKIRNEILQQGQNMVSFSLSSIPGIITLVVYLVLVPLLVFFFLKDKATLLTWFRRHLPSQRRLATQVWEEMDQQIGNYVRGKFLEIMIVGLVTYVVFAVMGMRYSMLLGALVGVSVLVPYLGAAVVTLPVAIIGYFQWGWGSDFAYIMLAYGIIQALDGNLLVPLLFSEAVNLHPVSIIVAVLVFGGMWGVWGVFFAIPLATLVKAVLNAWPSQEQKETGQTVEQN